MILEMADHGKRFLRLKTFTHPRKNGGMNGGMNERGAILIFVIIMALVFGLIAANLIAVFNNELKGVNTLRSKKEKGYIAKGIKTIFMSKKSCRASLGGHSPNTLPGNVLKIIKVRGQIDDSVNLEGTDTALLDITAFTANSNEALAATYGNGLLKIRSFSLSTASALGPNSVGTATLEIDFLATESSYARNRRETLDVDVKTDSTGNILECGIDAVF